MAETAISSIYHELSIVDQQLSKAEYVGPPFLLNQVHGREVDAVYEVGVNQVDDDASLFIKNFQSHSEYLQCDSRKTEFPHHYHSLGLPPLPSSTIIICKQAPGR